MKATGRHDLEHVGEAAFALGIKFPESILVLADSVIEWGRAVNFSSDSA